MGRVVTVNFRNDTLFAIEQDDGVFVALKPICDSMGLAWGSQHNRLLRDPILSEGIFTTKMPSVGGAQETTCLRLDLVNGWLFTIDESRVRGEETRQRVLAYKRDCYAVLFREFYGKRRAPEPVSLEPNADEPTNIRRSLVTEARQTFGVQAGKELWLKLNLPTTPAMMADADQGALFTYTAIQTPSRGVA